MLNLIPGVRSTSSALTAERTRLDIIAQNIANTNTTRGLNGRPYQRQQVVFESALNQATFGTGGEPTLAGPRVSRIESDSRPPLTVYMPGHRDADRDGNVLMPNVNVHEEVADMIVASRSFDANLAVLKTAKQMTMQALSIGKR